MSSNEVLVAREATRLAVVLDIDFKTLGHPSNLIFFFFFFFFASLFED